MGIPIVYGRAFDFRDTPTSPRVAIVNEALAQKEFVGINPVGKTFTPGEEDRYEIIGVSADASTQAFATILFPLSMFYTDSKRTFATA